MRDILIKGNVKMGPEVFLYNLPPVLTCTPTQWCLGTGKERPGCYAQKNNFRLPSTMQAARERYELSQRDDFAEMMIEAINRRRVAYFRWHSSGDFYSREYAEKVMVIVARCPDTLFRTTTRRRDLAGVIRNLNKLPNMIVRESLDPYRPIPRMGLPFAALSHMEISRQGDAHKCADDCAFCGYYCWHHDCNVHFAEF
jgi:hypothetical protein